MYYGGFSYSEAYALDIPERMWFIKRIVSEVNRSNEASEQSSQSEFADMPMYQQPGARSRTRRS